jgi:hypothetical protein
VLLYAGRWSVEAPYIVVDVKSAIARFGLGATSPRPDAESQIEYLACFRFPVTWNYIGGSAPEVECEVAAEPLIASPPLTLVPIVPAAPSRTPVALDVVGTDDGVRPTSSAARWEMMVPKMASLSRNLWRLLPPLSRRPPRNLLLWLPPPIS